MSIFSRRLTFWPSHYINQTHFFLRHLPALISDRNQTRSREGKRAFPPSLHWKMTNAIPHQAHNLKPGSVNKPIQARFTYLTWKLFSQKKPLSVYPTPKSSLSRSEWRHSASRKFQIPFRNKLAVRHTCCRRRRQSRSFVCAINTPRKGGVDGEGELEKCYFSSKTM